MEFQGITVYDLYMLVNSKEEKYRKELESLKEVFLQGWVRTNRDNGSIGFIALNDGTCFKNIQLVYDEKNVSDYKTLSHVNTGAALAVKGKLVLTPNGKQPFEVNVSDFEIVGDVAEDYPLQKKAHSLEFLREIAHLRPRANTFNAVFRMRNAMSMAIHEFFQQAGFMYIHTPIITGNDAEGAGNTFGIYTNDKNPKTDFFGKEVALTVSGQLHVEPFALAFRDVYTFGPTFRAEHSNTTRHASEFWMIEPEIAFADLNDDMECIEACIKHCIDVALNECKDEMEFFNNFIDKSLKERLTHVLNSEFKRLTYTQAIEELQKAVKNGHKFENNKIEWGMDLQSEHERYLTEQVIKGPVFVTDYPKESLLYATK